MAKFNDSTKTIIGASALLLAIVGSLLSGRMAKIFKSTRTAISIIIVFWAISIALLAITTSPIVFIVVSAVNGFLFGVLYSLSRAYYSDLAPKDRQGEFFGIYTLFERSASILGPLVWSGAVLAFAHYGPVAKYRFAMLSLAALVMISFFVLSVSRYNRK